MCGRVQTVHPRLSANSREGRATTTEIDGWLPWSLAKDHRLEGGDWWSTLNRGAVRRAKESGIGGRREFCRTLGATSRCQEK